MKYILTIVLFFSMCLVYAQHEEIAPTDGFKVTGFVKKEFIFHVSDVAKYKQDNLGDVIIRNRRGEEKGVAKGMKGILLKTILDSAGIQADKPKEYSEIYIVLIASDGYKNVYSWDELFNSETGNHIYVITAKDGKTTEQMPDRIVVMSVGDYDSGRRHLKALAKVEVRRVE